MADSRVPEALELARSTMFPEGHVLKPEEEEDMRRVRVLLIPHHVVSWRRRK